MKKFSKTRLQIQQDSIARRQVLLAYVEQHGPACTIDIVAGLPSIPRAVIFQWLRGMEADDHVICTKFVNKRGHLENAWARGPNKDALPMFKVGGSVVPIRDVKVHQRCVKAKQIGMPRYGDLPAAFFGQVQV